MQSITRLHQDQRAHCLNSVLHGRIDHVVQRKQQRSYMKAIPIISIMTTVQERKCLKTATDISCKITVFMSARPMWAPGLYQRPAHGGRNGTGRFHFVPVIVKSGSIAVQMTIRVQTTGQEILIG